PIVCPARVSCGLPPLVLDVQILGFKPAARLEQVGEQRSEQMQNRKHRFNDATILPDDANPPAGWNFRIGQEYCVMRTRTPPLAPGKLTDDVTIHIVLNDFGEKLGRVFLKRMKQKPMNGLSSAKSLAASTPTRCEWWLLISPRAGHAMSPRISRKL